MTNDSTLLGAFCDQSRKITYGIVQPGKASNAGVPIVRVNNFKGHALDLSEKLEVAQEVEAAYERSRPKPGDLLISLVGTIGQVAIASAEIEGWNLARAVGLVPFDDIEKAHWAAYAIQLKENQHFIRQRANTTVQSTFNLKDLAQIPIPRPGKEIEKSALKTLRMLDDKIELNRRMNETLEEMARTLFRDWFVDFGPTRRQMEGATDPVAIMGGAFPADKAAALVPIFPATHGESGLPEGWSTGRLNDLANAVTNTVKPAEVSQQTHYIGLEHMPRRSIALGEWEAAEKVTSNKSAFEKGQILFGKLRPYFHKVGIAAIDGICSTDIVVVDALRPELRPFLATLMSTDEFVSYTNQTSSGTRMPRTSWKLMRDYEVARAPTALLTIFGEIVGPLHAKIHQSIHENLTLAQLRNLLLPKLMSGEVSLVETSRG